VYKVSVVSVSDCISLILSRIRVIMTACKLASGLNLENVKATITDSKCVILIFFSLQQWFHERASFLRCTYIACLVLTRRSIPSMLVCVWHTVVKQPKSTDRHDLCNIIYYVIGRLTVWNERRNTIEQLQY
jgi:hypothetical protein